MIVVVLGQELSSRVIHPHLRDRVEVGIDAFRTTGARHLLLSGGRRNRAIAHAESDVMAAYARRNGVGRTEILQDRRSRDTIGNGYFSRLVLDDLRIDTSVLYLVTDASHAERAAFVFEQCFGDSVEIDTSYAVPTEAMTDRERRSSSLERTKAFFDPITPGDLEAIRRRLLEEHDWYDREAATPTV